MPDVIAPATRAPRSRVTASTRRTLLATINAVKEMPASREVPVSRQQSVDERHLQRVSRRVVQRRGRRTHASDRSSATAPIIPPCWRGSGPWSDADRIPPARAGVVHHRRHRQHRGGSWGDSHVGGVARRRRHRPPQASWGCRTQVRNGYERIRISFDYRGRRAAEKLREIVRAVVRTARRCSTCSPTVCRSTSASTLVEAHRAAHDGGHHRRRTGRARHEPLSVRARHRARRARTWASWRSAGAATAGIRSAC